MVGRLPAILPLLQARTLRDQAYRALHQAISTGDLAPGSRLIEAEISAALGISRGPVREAIRQLESEGLLVTRSHRDTHVVNLSATDVAELYAVRAALEGFAAVSGLEALHADHLGAMEQELTGLDQAAQEQDWDRVAVLDLDWHRHIIMAANNSRLTALWTMSNGPLRVIFARVAHAIYHPDEVLARHAALLAILRAAEPAIIEREIRDHYRTTTCRFAKLLDQDIGSTLRGTS
jgi:DNA-binding GntR family transcriptional regulator